MKKYSISTKIGFLVVSILAVSIALFTYSFFRYDLSVTTKDGEIQLHTLQLGEYYTPVKDLKILKKDKELVVHFVPNGENSMMHTITITPGRNEFSDMYLDGYSIEGKDYEFKKGEEYIVSVSWPFQSSKIHFTIN